MALKLPMQVATSGGMAVTKVGSSSTSTYKDLLVKPLVVGAVTGAAANMIWPFSPSTYTINMFGQRVPIWLGVGGAAFLASIASETLHKYAFPHVGDKWGEPISLGVSAGANGAALAGVLHVANSTAVGGLGLLNIVGTGAVAEMVGDQLYERFIKPMFL